VLVLTRRLHEKIVLPSLGMTIQVVAIKGGTVRLGIEAPPDVRVLREELLAAPALIVPDIVAV
jgi:carbon storage regulator CsrA